MNCGLLELWDAWTTLLSVPKGPQPQGLGLENERDPGQDRQIEVLGIRASLQGSIWLKSSFLSGIKVRNGFGSPNPLKHFGLPGFQDPPFYHLPFSLRSCLLISNISLNLTT